MPTLTRAKELAKADKLQVHWQAGYEGLIANVYNIKKDTAYVVYMDKNIHEWMCTCKHAELRITYPNMGYCKHIGAVIAKCQKK